MEVLFEAIINNLREGKSISEVTKKIKLNISNKIMDTSNIILAFIKYLKTNYLNENNSAIFSMIEKYFDNQISLQELSQETFLKRVLVDQDKRDGHQAQFRHAKNETFLDEIFRVIYEFTRNDLIVPKGVCYDFCLFIAGLSVAKNGKKQVYIWNSIEKVSGENNFILFCVEEDGVIVYDPFNGIYMPLEKYDVANVGFKLIKLDNSNILTGSMELTGFDQNLVCYEEILKIFGSTKESYDSELETLKRQNYYQRLSVDKSATFDDIKASFIKLVAKYHPYVNQNDKHATEKVQLIIEAYDCLKSDVLRREYDSKKFQGNSSEIELPKPSNNTQASTNGINFDEEFEGLEDFIRKVRKEYHIDSYGEILKLLTEMIRQITERESGESDMEIDKYVNYIADRNNSIYNNSGNNNGNNIYSNNENNNIYNNNAKISKHF